MKIFLDSADIDEIKTYIASGFVDGVTTNPSLIAKSGRNILEAISEICALVDGPVSAEVAATDHETMLAEGRKLAKLAPNVTVKVPPEAVHTKDWISRTYPSWLPAYVPQLPPVYPGKQVQRPIVWSQMPRFEQSTWHLLPLAPVP